MRLPNRTFGVELEIVGLSEEGAFLALRHAGIPVEDPQHWDPRSRNKWKMHEDCSIVPGQRDSYRSVEVVSPILRGNGGLKEVRKVCKALQKFGGKVNSSCGLHVHVEAKDLSPQEVVAVIKRYSEYEKTIDKFVHSSRRGDRNEYCTSTKEIAGAIDRWIRIGGNSPSSVNDLIRVADGVVDRTIKVNLLAYDDHGTIEFRHHNGSIDGRTVTNWIRFVLNFVEQSRALADDSSAKKKKVSDRGPLMGLPSYVKNYYNARTRMQSTRFSAYAA